MRRTIMYGILIVLAVAAARALRAPLFTEPSYTHLLGTFQTVAEGFVYTFILVLVFLIAVYIALKENGLPKESMYALTASPALVVAGVQFDTSLLIGVAVAIAFAVWNYPYVLAVVAGLISLVHPAGSIVSIFLLAGLIGRKHIVPSLIVAAITLGALWFSSFSVALAPPTDIFLLGGSSLFILLLGITGVFLLWNKFDYPRIVFAIALATVSVFVQELYMVGALVIAVFAGVTIKELLERTWIIDGIRNISILLVVCGLLFTATVAASSIIQQEPSQDFVEVRTFLQGSIPQHAVFVLSQHEDILRWHGLRASSTNERKILASRDFDITRTLVPHYIMLHSEDEAENLRFLIRNTDNFKLVFDGEYSVWKVDRN